ncbi:MAG: CTAG/PCC1 family protein [Candidatus Methanomethyliaceae archaeon]|nr:CTAG/PCC1 family protein [Candidatus Methanomethyliaceae archaeon]
MRSEITISRDYGSNSLAENVRSSIKPDNKELPAGTSIKMKVSGNFLLIKVFSTGGLPSFLRTIDDLLLCIQVAEGATKAVN